MTDSPKLALAVYQLAQKRYLFPPRVSLAHISQCAYSWTNHCCQCMKQTDRSCLIIFPPTEPGGPCPSAGERDRLTAEKAAISPSAPVQVSFLSVGVYILLFQHLTLYHLGFRLNFTTLEMRALTNFQEGSSICIFLTHHLVYFLHSLFVLLFLPILFRLSLPFPPPLPPFLKPISWFPVTCI